METYEEDIDPEDPFDEMEDVDPEEPFDEIEDVDPEEPLEEIDEEEVEEIVEVQKVDKHPTILSPPVPSSSEFPSGKDIAQVVSELLNSKIFGDSSPDETLSKIATDTLVNADRLREEFESKLQGVQLKTPEDRIMNGQLYGDLAGKALIANDQRIGTLNALAKFVPKASSKPQVNVAQQLNSNQTVNGINPEEFVEVLRMTESAGMNPIARLRDMEESAAKKVEEEEKEEENEDQDHTRDGFISAESVKCPTVDDFS